MYHNTEESLSYNYEFKWYDILNKNTYHNTEERLSYNYEFKWYAILNKNTQTYLPKGIKIITIKACKMIMSTATINENSKRKKRI